MASYLQFCFIILLCGKDSPSATSISLQQQTLPVSGEDFTIECRYPPSSYPRSAQWRHEDIQVASQSCTSTSSCTTTIHNPTKYKLKGNDHSSSLTIINLTAGDNGRYACDFINKSGIWSADETIQVLDPVPPSRVFVSDTQSVWQYSNNANISVTPGLPYNIICGANTARPAVVLEWLIPEDVAVVHQDQSDDIRDGSYISRKSLTVSPSREDHGKILICIASHPELQKNIRRSISLNVHVLPTSVLLFLTGGNQSQSTVLYVQEDSPTSITCKSIGSFPATELLLALVGDSYRTRIHANSSSNMSVLDGILFDTEITIAIRPDAANHGMNIVCSSHMEDAFFLKVLTARLVVYGLPVDVTISFPGDMFEGAETNITCRAPNGYPAPLIHWYIGSRNLTDNSSLETSLNAADRYDAESTLTFIPTRFDHRKRLLCQALQPNTTSTAVSKNNSTVLNISSQHRGAMSVMKQ
ncbi:synaptogenesis protein syg-2-like [Lytechinus variegatus]|uniref:synaptogenesis protein syg-2-like n=1 Tax=Lytechinus variegatus TaxID=7654 RepID=UPI001BB1ED91|nr:synaptogenesis protein syg-2-like [Lytechinus variegatus]